MLSYEDNRAEFPSTVVSSNILRFHLSTPAARHHRTLFMQNRDAICGHGFCSKVVRVAAFPHFHSAPSHTPRVAVDTNAPMGPWQQKPWCAGRENRTGGDKQAAAMLIRCFPPGVAPFSPFFLRPPPGGFRPSGLSASDGLIKHTPDRHSDTAKGKCFHLGTTARACSVALGFVRVDWDFRLRCVRTILWTLWGQGSDSWPADIRDFLEDVCEYRGCSSLSPSL